MSRSNDRVAELRRQLAEAEAEAEQQQRRRRSRSRGPRRLMDFGEPRLAENGVRAQVNGPIRRSYSPPTPPRERSRSRNRNAGEHVRNIRQQVAQRRREMREQRNNLRPVQDGVLQERWVEITVTGRFDYYESGVHHENQTYEGTRAEQRKIKFSSRSEYHDKLRAAVTNFKSKIAEMEEAYWVITWINVRIDDGYAEDEMEENAEDEAEIGVQLAEPIDNRFLRGANVNRLSKEDLIMYRNCLIKEFIQTYGSKIPSLAPERGGVEKCCEIMGITVEEATEKGIRIKQFKKLCDYYKISLLAINHFYKLVIPRVVHKKSKYSTFACYVYDAHCYPIADKAVKSNLSHSFAEKTESATKVVKRDESKAKEREIKDELKRFKQEPRVDVAVSELDSLEDGSVVYYHQQDLYSVLVGLLKEKNTLYVHKHTRKHVSSINYDRNIKLYCNPNHRSNLDWTDSMRIAKALKIPFQNQSISALAWEHMNAYYHPRGAATKRIGIPKKLRKQIIGEQNSICNHCRKEMGAEDIEINHIRAVSSGGLTVRANLEALHKSCHAEISSQQAMERLMNIDNSMSYYNDKTFEIFNRIKNGLCHNFIDISTYARFSKEKRVLAGLDLNKCRRNMLRYANVDEWCCFSVLDSPVKYDSKLHKDLPRGFYFVKSENILPLEGNGWYSVPMIRYCLKHKIIQEDQIQFAMLSSMHLPAHYFHKWIDFIVTTLTDPVDAKIVKLLVNGLIGMWATRSNTFRQMRFFNVEKAANADWRKRAGEADTSFTVMPRRFDPNDESGYKDGIMIPEFFEAKWHTQSEKLENHMPLFMQCLDLERIECHRIARRIEKAGGVVCHVNTDAVVGSFQNQMAADAFHQAAESIEWVQDVPKYKPVSGITKGKHDKVIIPSEMTYELPNTEYRNLKDPEHHDFTKYSTCMLDKLQSFILEAPAGCGKTTMLLAIIEELTKKGKRFLVSAPTHQARKLLSRGGHLAKTIHSALSCLKHGNGFHRFANYDYIIVDECSMISEPLWMMLCRIKQKCPNVKFIIAGCFKQLPPVQDRVGQNFNYKDSYAIHWLVDGVKQHLWVNRRGMGDPEAEKLFKMYMKPKTVDTSLFGNKECKRSICFTNRKRKEVNLRWMQHFAERADDFIVAKKPADGYKHNQDLYIYKGLPLIACRTRAQFDICNADRLVVVKYSNNNVYVRQVDEDGEQFDEAIKIPLDQITVVCQPGYCSTLHRQQGASIGEEYTLYEWNKYSDAMKYVGLSRTRFMKFINIVHEEAQSDEDNESDDDCENTDDEEETEEEQEEEEERDL